MRFVICWALTALAALPWVSGQDAGGSSSPASSALTQMPACGLRCLASAVANSTCSATNTTCVCTSGTITTQVTACVVVSCSVADSLVTKNVSNTICQIPSQDESNSYVNTTITLAVISNVLVLLRIGYKLFTRQELWWDDYLIIVVILAGIPSVIITAQGTTKNGLGKDVWTLTPTQITNFGYYFYFMEILYFLQLTLLKITLLCFYLRIFPATGVKRLLWATVGFTALWGSVFVLLAIFQCWPISFYWENWDGIHNGKCMNVNGLGWANAAISIALDIWMLAIPIWQVRSLQIHWKKKIGVSLMFFVGTFITVVSILRLQTLVSFAASTNPTMDNLMVSVWSTVEINVGIFCVCMPVLRLMLVRAVPILGSTNRSRLYGGGSRLKSNPSSHNRSRGLSNAIKHDGKGPSGDSKGIIYQQAYSVQYSTATDEEVLINMRDLELHTSKKQEASSNV